MRFFKLLALKPAKTIGSQPGLSAEAGPGPAGPVQGPLGQRGALSGSCAQVPKSASERFLLSAPYPGGVDRAPPDAELDAVQQENAVKTFGF